MRRRTRAMVVLMAAGLGMASPAVPAAGAAGAIIAHSDPLQSPQWAWIHKELLQTGPVVFDSRVRVTGPAFAEDPMRVPIAFDASALGEVDRIVVAVDRNPIREVLAFEPLRVRPSLSFRFKLEQASPVRVAARTRDGTWHVGSVLVDAGGGGCTVPGATRRDGSWSRTLNRVDARVFPGFGGAAARVRLRVMHPMDTGLAAGIPAFHIETLVLADAARQPLLRLTLHEPVAENPIFSFDLRDAVQPGMTVAGHDNNGNRIAARVAP
ncbi:quinoprotein dehydrogenase-associated SoxYZ-like carrier [Cupriavidus sp. UYPR2.512]|uniref:quinoprotein dehydrogenase-associated SoxYZ-like carrier n=1 Tax=Cupriavidus sp. UYPR2.512 TaxID=1080187 RepID=UPI000688784D|nr:quinoprotein dehydrogenase-associated SoxYZ-like carrier [Cupriavidus sp. UYPR2.512]UIF90321.1 quinoprotein dehydrogenase-associated SoxYZ-like carrier [Cupriavidus necator]